jgi:transcription antitermination factor NusG
LIVPLDAHAAVRVDTHQQATGHAYDPARTPSGCRPGPRWFVVATYPQAEQRAVASLQAKGFQTYLPLITVTRRNRRHERRQLEVALFPAYAFVRLDLTQPWYPVRYAPGVFSLISVDGMPTPCPDAAVEALQAAQALAATQAPETSQWALGASVAVANGPFQGHPAVVLEVEPKTSTVAIAILAFGQLHRVTLRADRLVARE